MTSSPNREGGMSDQASEKLGVVATIEPVTVRVEDTCPMLYVSEGLNRNTRDSHQEPICVQHYQWSQEDKKPPDMSQPSLIRKVINMFVGQNRNRRQEGRLEEV
jgi:hypothetical protein